MSKSLSDGGFGLHDSVKRVLKGKSMMHCILRGEAKYAQNVGCMAVE